MITEVNEIWENVQANVGETGYRTYTRTFRVHSDIINEGPIAVGNHPDIPQRYDSYVNTATGESDSEALCKTITVHTTDDPFSFLVTAEYTTENPLTVPCEVTWGSEQRTEVADKTADDPPLDILNSAGEPFDPPLQVERYRDTLTVVKNLADYDPAFYRAFKGKVNAAMWVGGAAGTWKCKDITAVKQIEKELQFWKVTFVFIYEEAAWIAQVLDQGYNRLVSDPDSPLYNKLTRIIDQGAPTPRPVLLNGAGDRKTPSAAPVFRPFVVHADADFDLLPFVEADL